MALTIFTNESKGKQHAGNPDRDDPSKSYDTPERLLGTLDVVRSLNNTLRASAEANEGASIASEMLRLGTATACEPMYIRESARIPSDRELLLAHTPEYVTRLKQAAELAHRTGELLEFGPEAKVSAGTYEAAVAATGATLDMVDYVLGGPGRTGFSLVWPPGHHAEPDQAFGFCYLNHAAIAALYARHHATNGGQEPYPVLVIDIDHHTANGTRRAVANKEHVLLIDMDYEAAYDEVLGRYIDYDSCPVTGKLINSGKEYPYRRDDSSIGARAHPIAYADNIIELRFPKSSPEKLVETFLDSTLHRIKEFSPRVVIWSLGIDSAMGDPLGGLGHVPGSFYTLLRGLRLLLPEASHAAVLEGGYDRGNWVRVLPACLYALHHPADDPRNHSQFFARKRARFERS